MEIFFLQNKKFIVLKSFLKIQGRYDDYLLATQAP